MSISDKTRKVLWARSGNRCVLCRRELVVKATGCEDVSVIGEEAHIISGQPNGPRYDSSVRPEHLDLPENLILVCSVHHKIIDDRPHEYTVQVLREQKARHEAWVSSALSETKIRLCREQPNKPVYLVRQMSGRDVLRTVGDACAFEFDHDELRTAHEIELVSDFLQEAQDVGDLYGTLEAGEQVRTACRLDSELSELEAAGFYVFGGREVRRLEGAGKPPEPFPVAILRVVRATNPEIIKAGQSPKTDQGQRRASC